MSEIRDKVKEKIKCLLEDKDAHFTANWLITDQILSIPEIAIVDRDAELPQVSSPEDFEEQGILLTCITCREIQHKAGWVKEVR